MAATMSRSETSLVRSAWVRVGARGRVRVRVMERARLRARTRVGVRARVRA